MGIEQGKEQVSRVHFSKEKPEINCLFPNPSGKLSIKARPQTLVICPKAFLPPRQQSRHGTTNRRSRGLYWGLADVMEVGGRGGIPGLGLGKGREEAKGPRSRNPALPASTLQPLPHPRFLTPASPCLWEHRAPRMDKQDPPGPQLGVGCRIQDSVCLFCPQGEIWGAQCTPLHQDKVRTLLLCPQNRPNFCSLCGGRVVWLGPLSRTWKEAEGDTPGGASRAHLDTCSVLHFSFPSTLVSSSESGQGRPMDQWGSAPKTSVGFRVRVSPTPNSSICTQGSPHRRQG